MAKEYSVYETKARLSELLRTVKSGKELIVTERGQPIARLVPFKNKKITFKERISALKNAGHISERKPNYITPLVKHPGALKRFLSERD